ncbi:Oidioi.mRNA.OKI2018_I69.XSR.g14373.t2.cds [Oikopleura dioica]|uniref:Oidioi.mRNA.OKI2018_I69.XSR.g14373.t2.cds n=1 Tax=Oikopleura dioica TaxID=34765 RepID=A0ABN7SDJ2_OIKDI|nr:Oidioi.mRNA.OKI2018_I69.XSR.g14373.t2.cds [Oikopleura dioica]
MMEPFANANETFKKLFDTGQQLNDKLEKEEKAHRELKTKFDELKKDFMHNLDLNKDLQSKVNELCSEKNALKTRLGLVQGDISEAVNKREMANARTEKAQVEKAKIEKELHDAHKLHASLTGVIHAEHKKFVDSLLQKHALEIENFKNSLQSLDIKLQSQRQELRLDYTRKRAKDKHELHQCITSANQERDRANLKLTAVENEKQNLELFIKDLEKDLKEKSATITSVSERLAHCELVIEENKAISKDYAQQIEKQFKEIQAHYEKKEFEWSNKIGVLEKQLRIECSKSEQMRVETDAQISVLEKAKNNIESLLHQEQVLHKTLREEHERDKQNYQSSLKMAEEKSCSFQKRAVELSEVETQLIAQNKTLQTITESQAQKIEEMLKANSEAAAEHDKEKIILQIMKRT